MSFYKLRTEEALAGKRATCRRFATAAVGVVLTVAVAACAPAVNTRGSVIDPELVSEIQPGTFTKDDVESLLGTPSSVGTFDDNTWYYITKKTQRWAFFEPDVLDQEVLVIAFDKKGVVSEIQRYDMNDAEDVEFVSRSTPTRGKSMTVFDQLLDTALKQLGGAGSGSPDPFQR